MLGCVVYLASVLVAPGVVRHDRGRLLSCSASLDELGQRRRAQRVSDCFTAAGFKAPVLDNIRAEIWLMLWGNLSFNPISGLSHSTLADICRFPPSRELAAEMMREAQAVAHKLGIEFRVTLEKRIAGAEKIGPHKTSMLQDIEAGRAPEIDALVGAVIELACSLVFPRRTSTPSICVVKLLARTMAERRRAGASMHEMG